MGETSPLRSATNHFYAGGGLGFRFWKFRASGQYLAFVASDNASFDKFAPQSIILAGLDFYVISTIFVGVNYSLINGMTTIGNTGFDQITFDKGTPKNLSELRDNNEFGIERSSSPTERLYLKVGFEF